MGIFSKKQTSQTPGRRRNAAILGQRATDASLSERYTFRRNRTLTGSASSQVTSLNETGAQLKSSRVQAHELLKRRRHLRAVLFLILLIAGGLSLLIWQFTASVNVRAEGETTLQLDRSYEETIQEYLGRRPIERLRFLTNEADLLEYLHANVPEIEAITIEGSTGFGRSSFVIRLRQPIAVWTINGREQYVDETGTAFSRNYFAAPSVKIVDNSGIRVESGQAVASNRFLGFVGRVVGHAKTNGYTVKQVIIPSGTTRQIELRLDGVEYPVKFSIDRPAGEQAEDMARGLRWLTTNNKKPAYLDVRVSGKAYYRE
jgi:hypothetical protein